MMNAIKNQLGHKDKDKYTERPYWNSKDSSIPLLAYFPAVLF